MCTGPVHMCGEVPTDNSRPPAPTNRTAAACGLSRRVFMSAASGFLEIGETGEEGAAREAREEMNAEIDVGGLLAVYGLPHIGQM